MKIEWGVVIPTVVIVVLLVLGLVGCSDMPSMKYCDKVTYTRDGAHAHVEMDCRLPVGGTLPLN